MAQYMVLIYEDEASWESASPRTWQRIMTEHGEFGERHGASLRGGNALEPTGTATAVRGDAVGWRSRHRAALA